MIIMLSGIHRLTCPKNVLAALMMGFLILSNSITLAATADNTPKLAYKTLHNFDGINDGSDPYEVGITVGKDGSLYGTTLSGGQLNGVYGNGTVYKINAKGTFKVLHVFDNIEGGKPTAAVTLGVDGSVYGTTSSGGQDPDDTGVVYKIDKNGQFKVLHSFDFETEGRTSSEVALGTDGSLYGTTFTYGTGANDADPATIFKIDTKNNYTVIHQFNVATHELPVDSVVIGKKGDLYGATISGKQFNKGSIYKLTAEGRYKVLHYFNNPFEGVPNTGVVLDTKGNIYGTTNSGGNFGYGTIFKIGTDGVYRILHHFDGFHGMESKGLTLKDGKLYGTASTLFDYGDFIDIGSSIAYEISSNSSYKIIHAFNSSQGGFSKLSIGPNGSYYGTERQGGKYERGQIFRLDAISQFKVSLIVDNKRPNYGQQVAFTAKVEGKNPTGQMIFIDVTRSAKILRITKIANGSASFATTELSPGKHIVFAYYTGDNNNIGSISKPVILGVK